MKVIYVLILLGGLFPLQAFSQTRTNPIEHEVRGCHKKTRNKKDGWYLITSGKRDSIAKKPILAVKDFAEIKLESFVVKGDTVYIIVGRAKPGKVKAWADATEKAIDSHIGFVFQNEIISYPRVNARIESGRFSISQNPFLKSNTNIKEIFHALERKMGIETKEP